MTSNSSGPGPGPGAVVDALLCLEMKDAISLPVILIHRCFKWLSILHYTGCIAVRTLKTFAAQQQLSVDWFSL